MDTAGHGEPGGTRTHDPMIKSHVLYQLSYGLQGTKRRVPYTARHPPRQAVR
jgi:hypothetical protein